MNEVFPMQKPVFKYEFNITTLVALTGLIGSLWLAAAQYTRVELQVDKLTAEAVNWRAEHMAFHRERAAETASIAGRTDERLKALEGQARAIDNLTYRMTVQEQGTTSLTAAVADLRQTISNVTGDIKLIREIVTRMEDSGPSSGQGRPSNR